MSVDYQKLPLYKVFDSVNEGTTSSYYHRLKSALNDEQISILQMYHKGRFQLSGVNYYMPEFLVSEEARCSLNYPQGFLIMEADDRYYTDRSGLDAYELRYTLEGEGMLIYRDRRYSIRPGEGYFIDCREPHFYQTAGESWRSTIFHLNGQLVGAIFRQYAGDDDVKFTAAACPDFEMLQFQILEESLKIAPYFEYRLSSLIDQLLTALLVSKILAQGAASDDQRCMEALITYVKDHAAEDLTLDFLAHRFHLSRTKLCSEFRQYTGFTIKQYVLNLRINQARQLLAYSLRSVAEISEETGFHDTAYFIQVFKKHTGMTPLQYRKQVSS